MEKIDTKKQETKTHVQAFDLQVDEEHDYEQWQTEGVITYSNLMFSCYLREKKDSEPTSPSSFRESYIKMKRQEGGKKKRLKY